VYQGQESIRKWWFISLESSIWKLETKEESPESSPSAEFILSKVEGLRDQVQNREEFHSKTTNFHYSHHSDSDPRTQNSSEILSFKFGVFALTLILTCIISIEALSQEFHQSKPWEFEQGKYKQQQGLKSLPQVSGYDVKSYRLDLQLDPTVNYISGSVVVYFEVTADSLSQFQLLLSDSMQVDSVYYAGVNTSYNHQNRIILVDLPQIIYSNSLDSIQVFYQGSPQSGGLGTFAQDTIPGGGEMIWTLSQPYGASDWWPCKDDLYDKADSVEIAVTTPLAYKVATNGLRQSIDTLGSQHRYTYKSSYPIASYLIAVAVGNYQFFEEHYQLGNDSLLIEHFLFPNETLSQSNDALEKWLLLFDSLFGEYPFIEEKYGHASFTRGGGMEHQTMSFMTGYGGELVAHELAHQWFGDKVTCANWQDLWLNEGFATYLTGLTYEFNVVHDSIYWPLVLDQWKQTIFQFPDQSVFRADTTDVSILFNPLAYQKGACFLHMLRWVSGDSAFFAGIRNYINDPQLEYGFATTADLKSHFEASSGKNLDEFFKDWFYGKGFPTYTTVWSQTNGRLDLQIEQLPSHPSVYFFNIPLPYKLHASGWDSSIVLNPRFSNERFTLNVGRSIDSLVFDPEGWILAQHDVVTGLADPIKAESSQIKVFPNPFKNEISIEGVDLNDLIKLYDSKSRLIHQWNYKDRKVILPSLSKGAYFLKIETTDGILSYPLFKQ